MPATLPLSVLDLGPVAPGGDAAGALRGSLELARVAEDAGYARYWVAEHHLNPGVASSSTLDIRTGRGAQPYVTPEQARARAWTAQERAGVVDRTSTQFVGSPTTVRDGLEILARANDADELLLTTITTDPGDRTRSYELLARAWS